MWGAETPQPTWQMPLGMGDEAADLEEGGDAQCITAGKEQVVPRARRRGTGPRPRPFPEPKGMVLGLWVVEGLARSPREGLFATFDSDRERHNQRVPKSKG